MGVEFNRRASALSLKFFARAGPNDAIRTESPPSVAQFCPGTDRIPDPVGKKGGSRGCDFEEIGQM